MTRLSLVLAILVSTSSASVMAETFKVDINLFELDPSVTLVKAENAELYTDGLLRFWRPTIADQVSEVIYRIDAPHKMGASTIFPHSDLIPVANAFLTLEAGKSLDSLQQFAHADVNTPGSILNKTFDISFATAGSDHVYVRAVSLGDVATRFISEEHNGIFPYLSAELVPEPSVAATLLGLCGFGFRKAGRRRQTVG